MMQAELAATILVVDDDRSMRSTLIELLEGQGLRAIAASSATEALELLQARTIDLIITDLRMPGMKGEELLQQCRSIFPEVPVIAITAFGSVQDAVALTRAGAAAYLEKPFAIRLLLDSVTSALEDAAPARVRARQRRQHATFSGDIVGQSEPMLDLFHRIARVAASPAPVLITGESGTGKDLVARAVHRASGLKAFVAVNCGAIPDSLIESELFGHTRGAFTGATREKPGLFEAAAEGTLFLDEVAELPLPLQPRLLRAIETGEVRRVGEVEARRVKTRVVAATHRDLEEEVSAGRFREDLFWRLRVLHLETPPLREHPDDIPLLIDVFLKTAADRPGAAPVEVDPAARSALQQHHWPGNVRQLFNVLESALTFVEGGRIGVEDLPPAIRRASESREIIRSAVERGLTLEELEREFIFEVLRRAEGNKSRAAELLGMPRRTLYRRLQEYAAEDNPN